MLSSLQLDLLLYIDFDFDACNHATQQITRTFAHDEKRLEDSSIFEFWRKSATR
jgi:hypothetical protein